MDNQNGAIVGIDLGTTNSVVAAIVDGRPQVLAEDGESILPSVVAVNQDGQLITGLPARNQLAAFPERTVASIKRRMGSMEPVTLGEQQFTPPEVSAMLLRRLRDRATRALDRPVDRAVITVPAFFDDQQRQATREAGELAGLQVARIINEPTAATLVYHAGTQDRKHLVVYDLGGGTFDVSIVRMEAGVVEVLSSKGDTKLGGNDFDDLLLGHVADEFQEEHGIDLREDLGTRYRLLQACEQAKMRLSEDESVTIAEEFIADRDGQPLNLVTQIEREQFDELIGPLVDQTIATVDEALRDAKLTIHQIDDLVLVGGSTRIPLVQNRLRGEFLREPSRQVDPDLAVALGAAVQAGMIDGQQIGPVLVDVSGHTLGIAVCQEVSLSGPNLVFSPIIHRNSPLPARYEAAYGKVYDEQEKVKIEVLQGEHLELERNRRLGEFFVDLEAGGGERSKIVVRFDLTLDGTLDVRATQPATGMSRQLRIENALSQFKQEDRERAVARLGAMFDASEELTADADLPQTQQWESSDDDGIKPAAATNDESRYPAAAALLKQIDELDSGLNPEDAEEIATIRKDLQQALAENDDAAVATLCEALDDILFYVQ